MLAFYLIWVFSYVVVAYEAGDEFTVEEVMSVIDGSQTPVCVVVRVGAKTERSHCKIKEIC